MCVYVRGMCMWCRYPGRPGSDVVQTSFELAIPSAEVIGLYHSMGIRIFLLSKLVRWLPRHIWPMCPHSCLPFDPDMSGLPVSLEHLSILCLFIQQGNCLSVPVPYSLDYHPWEKWLHAFGIFPVCGQVSDQYICVRWMNRWLLYCNSLIFIKNRHLFSYCFVLFYFIIFLFCFLR